MKNRIFCILAVSFALLSGCQSPDNIEIPIDAQGLTRIIAKFTSGDYNEQIAGEIIITDMTTDTYVIPVPWYYPEESYNETALYMEAMKVEATLANNYSLTPPLGILDLTKDNIFTLTSPAGEKRQVILKGEVTKLNKSSITFFSVEDETTELTVTGSIDEASGVISLITVEDLSSVSVDLSVSPHATFSPAIEGVKFDLNNPTLFTVTAHNGVDSKTYTVRKETPEKVSYGYAKGSEKTLWKLNPGDLGIAWGRGSTSLASIGNHLIVSAGDGSVPIYLNRTTGAKLGTIIMGSANASGCVTNDANDNLLISNATDAGQTLNIYRTKSVRTAPTLYLSYENTTGLAISRIAVQGDIDGTATIIATCDRSSRVVRWDISDGIAGTPQVIEFSGVGSWGAQSNDAGNTRVVPLSTNKNDGYLLSYYSANVVYHVDGQTNTGTAKVADGSSLSWARNQSRLDVKEFNNARYLVLGSMSYFPQWAIKGMIYMYDITSLSLLTGDVSDSPALVYTQTLDSNNAADPIFGEGDVLLVPSSNGFYLHLYYWDNNHKILGAYSFDCINK